MRSRGVFVCALVIVSGCGAPGTKHAPVSGKVTMDGKPLANVAVSFQPIGNSLNPGAGSSGRTNENGEYTLEVIGGNGTKGAVIGMHRVEVNPTVDGNTPARDDDRGGGGPPVPRVRIPAKYNLKTELTFEVKAGAANVADFKLNSK